MRSPVTVDTDVVVVGAGLAGVACALAVAETADAEVVVLDRGGGSSNQAIGSFTVAGTPWQRAIGIHDTPADHLTTLEALCAFDGPPQAVARYRRLLARMAESGLGVLETLGRWGVEFRGPYPEPPHPVPRMHNVTPDTATMMARLAERLETTGRVTLCRGIRVERVEHSGVDWVVVGNGMRWRARVVVLASGDQSATHPRYAAVNPHADGRLWQQVAASYGLVVHPPEWLTGLRAWVTGLPRVAPTEEVVARATVRAGDTSVTGRAWLDDPGDLVDKVVYLDLPDTPEVRGMTAGTFPAQGYATVQDLIEHGLGVVGPGPVVRLGPFRAAVTLADGGLDVDEAMQCLNTDDQVVSGLLACGAAALGGIRLRGHGHHLLWAAWTGLTAARTISLR